MTNQEKLKKILQTINSNGNLAAVVSELLIAVDSSSLDVLAQLPEDNSTIELKNNLNTIFSNNADAIKNFKKTKQDYISALEKTTNSKWIEKAEELFNKNYTSAGAKNLFGEFKKIYESVSTRSMQKASIVALSAFAATCAQHEKDPNIAVLKEFITLASFSFEDVFVGKTLAEHCVETIRIADPSLAEKTTKLFDRILTANKIAYTPNNANHIGCSVKKDKDNQVLSYYENMQKQPLVQNFDKVDETTTIEEAIAKFDLKENSKYIAYALSKLEGKIRENPDLKTDNTGLAVLASEIAFLYMCAAGQKEVDDKVLAAILDPVIEINTTHGGKAIEKAVEAANDVVKGLTGKDYFAEQRPIIIGENGNPESGNDEPPESENGGNPEDGNDETPESENGGNPEDEINEVPENENDDSSDSGNVGNPEDVDGGNPEGGNHENPENGNGSFTPPKDVETFIKKPAAITCANIMKAAKDVLGKLYSKADAPNARKKKVTQDQRDQLSAVNAVFLKNENKIKRNIRKNKTEDYIKYADRTEANQIVQKLVSRFSEIFKEESKPRNLKKEITKILAEILRESESFGVTFAKNFLKTKDDPDEKS